MGRFDHISGFEWDAGNTDKNWEKHGVSNAECEEVFSMHHLLFVLIPAILKKSHVVQHLGEQTQTELCL